MKHDIELFNGVENKLLFVAPDDIAFQKKLGCVFGGAAGDALGFGGALPYPLEFLSRVEIERVMQKLFGEQTLRYVVDRDLDATPISDDTQMSMFTMVALIRGATLMRVHNERNPWRHYLSLAYQDWNRTQPQSLTYGHKIKDAWIGNIPALNVDREPGGTCLSAISQGADGTIEYPINSRHGCGGLMRVAPIGVFLESDKEHTVEDIARIGAEAAALTHGHGWGYMPAAALVYIVNQCLNSTKSLNTIVVESTQVLERLFPNKPQKTRVIDKILKAVELVNSDREDIECIEELGAGWKAEETLAISIYCALKYSDNFDKALTTAATHDGDSDSTGAVTGNILGAYLGIQAIPEKYITTLEFKELLLELTCDLHNCRMMSAEDMVDDTDWSTKYLKACLPERFQKA